MVEFLKHNFVYKWVYCPRWINMANPLSKTHVFKALLTPKVASNDLVLHLVAVDIVRGDPREPNNQPKEYPKFVSGSKLYYATIARYGLDPWFPNLHRVESCCLENHM